MSPADILKPWCSQRLAQHDNWIGFIFPIFGYFLYFSLSRCDWERFCLTLTNPWLRQWKGYSGEWRRESSLWKITTYNTIPCHKSSYLYNLQCQLVRADLVSSWKCGLWSCTVLQVFKKFPGRIRFIDYKHRCIFGDFHLLCSTVFNNRPYERNEVYVRMHNLFLKVWGTALVCYIKPIFERNAIRLQRAKRAKNFGVAYSGTPAWYILGSLFSLQKQVSRRDDWPPSGKTHITAMYMVVPRKNENLRRELVENTNPVRQAWKILTFQRKYVAGNRTMNTNLSQLLGAACVSPPNVIITVNEITIVNVIKIIR